MVECSASTPTLVPATVDTRSSAAVAYFLVGSWPAASMFMTRGSGPTCIGLP
jgi:hypothetical protein